MQSKSKENSSIKALHGQLNHEQEKHNRMDGWMDGWMQCRPATTQQGKEQKHTHKQCNVG